MSDLQERLRIVGHERHRWADVINALTTSPAISQTIDGASTLTLVIADPDRTFLRSPLAGQRSWAKAGGVHFEYVGFSKSAERFTLTFEDAIVAALRRRKAKLRVPAGSTTRRDLVRRLAKEANVKAAIYDGKIGRIHRVVARNTKKAQSNDSWALLEELAGDVQWRRFSNGRRLVVGPDDWLLERDARPTVLREYSGPCHAIDFDLDVGKRASKATVAIDVAAWQLPTGSVVEVHGDHGPAAGRWIVSQVDWTLSSTLGTASLIRGKHGLKEPKADPKSRTGSEPGSADFVPDVEGSPGIPGSRRTRPERMAAWALGRVGSDYVMGAEGPAAYDASGLVQEASRAAGRLLRKPAVNQWAVAGRQGAQVPVSRALATRGALLFRLGPEGPHVAISLGNGSTVEAFGPALGVLVVGDAADRSWTGGALWT